MFLFLLLLVPFLLVLYLEIKHFNLKRHANRFNGPSALPLIGNAYGVGRTPTEILNKMTEWWIQYGKKNFRMWVGYEPFVVLTEPKDVEFVLTHNTLISKSHVYDMLHPWLGEGLLTSTGLKWHKHRKMITPAFHFKMLHQYHDVMKRNSTKFIKKLEAASEGDTIFDFQEMAHYFTLDVICDTAMGVGINAMDEHDSKEVRAFQDMCYSINMRAFHPLKNSNKLFKFFPEYKQNQKTLKILQDFTYDVIKKRMQALKENTDAEEPANQDEMYSRKRQAFLDTLLTSTIDNRPLTLKEIYDEVSTFMFEGHDTTTSGVSFLVYLLSRHKKEQEKVYAEQEKILGENPKHDPTFQELSEMQYLDLVIKEAQRLYPSVPVFARCADKDYEMNGKIIPTGATVELFVYAMGYNEKHFPDPYRFNPERFDTSLQTEKRNPFEYVPFSAGLRNCIGQKFALLEIKTIVSKIVRHFEILPPLDELWSESGYIESFPGLSAEEVKTMHPNPSKYDPILTAVLTLKSENGLSIRLRKRN